MADRETINALMAEVERERPLRTTDYLATCAEEGRAPSPYARGLRYALTAPTVAALLALRLTRPSAR